MHSESLIKRYFLFFFHDFLMYNFKLTFVSKPKNQKINIDGVKSPREVRLGSNFRYIFAFFKFNSLQALGLEEEQGRGDGAAGEGTKRKLIVRAPVMLVGSHIGSVSDRHRIRVSNLSAAILYLHCTKRQFGHSSPFVFFPSN